MPGVRLLAVRSLLLDVLAGVVVSSEIRHPAERSTARLPVAPGEPARVAIADPPYPPAFGERRDRPGGPIRTYWRTRARRWYGDAADRRGGADFHPDAGEWDRPARHRELLLELLEAFDGWAIATTLDGLEHYRPLPIPCRVLIWHRPNSIPTAVRTASTLEAVIVYPIDGRRARRDTINRVPDLLSCPGPRSSFAGAKPAAWTRWVLDAIGYEHDDELVDLFPGSGAVTAAAAQGVLL